MFESETEVVELQSRLGRMGSIQAWDPWKSRRSVEDAKWWVSKIARLSHGLGETEDFVGHFDRVVNQLHHTSVLEFIPAGTGDDSAHLPANSARQDFESVEFAAFYGNRRVSSAHASLGRCHAFLVEAPIFVVRQWMRHRSFAYLEMSRRYTKGSKVAWEYGVHADYLQNIKPGELVANSAYLLACEDEYQRRLDAGWPNEIARGCMPVETLTKFWVAGFERDWEAFLKLRDDDHAQPEIRVFASWIRAYIEGRQKCPS